MLYIIEVLNNNKDKHFEIIVEYDGLFDMAWILDKSPHVSQFKVCHTGHTVMNTDFGYGSLDKWVTEFIWDQ